MATDTVVRARVNAETKEQAAEALEAMGLSISDYIRMALIRLAHDKAVPFPLEVPNALTAKTLRKSDRGEDIHAAKDARDLFKQLGI